MEMLGVMVALPQCIQAAKDLYDLRTRYNDASVLITAIYSESMVIAASLSQIQNLLQHDALQSKPQLLETLDRALTGCRVVYGCLDEEVRGLKAKAENDELGRRDKAKFLWKEETFKELLTQIRGQQSALSFLIQGLQMESIADIKQLVAENSTKLEQVMKRSRTLRQTHPRVQVPESIFGEEKHTDAAADADSILKSTDFAFDDEVINSKAYRRAMALYTSQSKGQTLQVPEKELEDDDLTAVDSVCEATSEVKDIPSAATPTSGGTPNVELKDPEQVDHLSITESSSPIVEKASETELEGQEAEGESFSQVGGTEEQQDFSDSLHQDLFDSLEQDILAFMPPTTPNASYVTSFKSDTIQHPNIQDNTTLKPAPLRSHSGGHQTTAPEEIEEAPPLPPRRPSALPSRTDEFSVSVPKTRTVSSDESTHSYDAPSILSKVSTASSYTAYEPSSLSSSRTPTRKPLPSSYEQSHNMIGNVHSESPTDLLVGSLSPLKNAEMHAIWLSLLDSERKFVERMTKLRTMFYDTIIRQWPILEMHLGAILVGEQLARLNDQLLLHTMAQQTAGDDGSICDPSVFEAWTNKAHKIYREYSQRLPHAVSSLRTTQNMDSKFSPFVNTLGLSIAYFGMGWEDYLKLPNVQLQSYIDNLGGLTSIAETLDGPAARREATSLKRALEAVMWLRTMTTTLLEEAQNREDVKTLERRIRMLDPDLASDLQLSEPTRRIMYQGGMAMKLKGQGPWHSVQVMLLDNYLLWGRAKVNNKNKGDTILIADPPIAVSDLELTVPCDAHQYEKATMFDHIPRGKVVYIITVKDKNSDDKPHMLGTYGIHDRHSFLKAAASASLK